MQKYSWINEQLEIDTTIEISDGKIISIVSPDDTRRSPGGIFVLFRDQKVDFISDADLLADGALPHIYPDPDRWQSYGDLVVEKDRISKAVVTMAAPADMRLAVEGKIYQQAQGFLSAATSKYSAAEMSQWSEMVSQASAGNWSYLDAMATPGLTGQEYGQIVLQKHAVLKAYFDTVIAARNTIKVDLAVMTDQQMYDLPVDWVKKHPVWQKEGT
jgi:hypothetical protein